MIKLNRLLNPQRQQETKGEDQETDVALPDDYANKLIEAWKVLGNEQSRSLYDLDYQKIKKTK